VSKEREAYVLDMRRKRDVLTHKRDLSTHKRDISKHKRAYLSTSSTQSAAPHTSLRDKQHLKKECMSKEREAYVLDMRRKRDILIHKRDLSTHKRDISTNERAYPSTSHTQLAAPYTLLRNKQHLKKDCESKEKEACVLDMRRKRDVLTHKRDLFTHKRDISTHKRAYMSTSSTQSAAPYR